METFLAILLLCVLVPPVIIYWKARFLLGAREHIAKAADFAHEGKFPEARHAVQVAINLNSALQRQPDAVSLHRIILSGSIEGQEEEIARVRRATQEWPKTRSEQLYGNQTFRIVVVMIWLLVLLSRLASIR